MFNEKLKEYDKEKGDLPVWQSPKYLESKEKALALINSDIGRKAKISEGDFWILMNKTKNGKMAYTGLIISHNGCLKLNAIQEPNKQFKPSCLTLDKNGWGDSLTYTYCNDEQGIYEVGEVSKTNCKNDYPYAMALKRAFDRVVLKVTELAFAGIYSDSEADEFKAPLEEREAPNETKEEQVIVQKPSKPEPVFENTNASMVKGIERLIEANTIDRDKFNAWLETTYKTSDLYLLTIEQLLEVKKIVDKKKPITKTI